MICLHVLTFSLSHLLTFKSQSAFSLDVFLEEQMFAIEHNVGELPYPVADDHHPRLAR